PVRVSGGPVQQLLGQVSEHRSTGLDNSSCHRQDQRFYELSTHLLPPNGRASLAACTDRHADNGASLWRIPACTTDESPIEPGGPRQCHSRCRAADGVMSTRQGHCPAQEARAGSSVSL